MRKRNKRIIGMIFLFVIVAAGFALRHVKPIRQGFFTEPVQQEDKAAMQDTLYDLLQNNPELADFVAGFAQADGSVTGGISKEEKEEDSPLFLQWDARWGYAPYGESCIGISGCAPTCLSMVIFSLTRDEAATPDKLADYSMEHGYYASGIGTQWSFLKDAAKEYGVVSSETSLDDTIMKRELDNGHPIIASVRKGDFTTQGHFIVIYGYDQEGFLIHDPNSRNRSAQKWTFEVLEPQIKNLWSYSID